MGNLALKQSGIGTLLNGNKSYGIVTGTISGLRISNVAGAYFIDNCAALLPYSGCRVRFKDAGGKYFDCLMGLRGVSEGLGDDAMSGFDFTSGWTGINATINDANTFTANAAGGFVVSSPTVMLLQIYVLYKTTFSANQTAGTTVLNWSSQAQFANGSTDIYKTSTRNGRIDISNSTSGAVVDIITATVFKVLTPSNQGLLLQAAPFVDTGFTYNAASYTYEVWS